MANQNQKSFWNKNPKTKEAVLKIEKRTVERTANGFIVRLDAEFFVKGSQEAIKDAEITVRENGIYLTHSTTNESGYTYFEHSFDLKYADSVILLDIFVKGYARRQQVEITFPSAPEKPIPPSRDAEHLSIETGFSRSEASYYIVARLLQAKGYALKQKLTIVIDGVTKTVSTDENGYMRYLIPLKISPQCPGDRIKVVVTASGIKEPAYGYIEWEEPQPNYSRVRNIFKGMVIAMPVLWFLALAIGLSSAGARFFFGGVMIYSTVIVPLFFLIFLSSFQGAVINSIRGIFRKVSENFSNVAGDSLFERISNSFKEGQKSGHPNFGSLFTKASSDSSGKGLGGWVMKVLKSLQGFFGEIIVWETLSHFFKRIFR